MALADFAGLSEGRKRGAKPVMAAYLLYDGPQYTTAVQTYNAYDRMRTLCTCKGKTRSSLTPSPRLVHGTAQRNSSKGGESLLPRINLGLRSRLHFNVTISTSSARCRQTFDTVSHINGGIPCIAGILDITPRSRREPYRGITGGLTQ